MVFNSNVVASVLLGVSIVWLIILTVFIYRMLKRYNRLVQGVSKTGLTDILDSIIGTQHALKKQTEVLGEAVVKLETETKLHIQRAGIVRFNPFSDTGGSQSFSLSLLDSNDNGIVMTSLYARTGNRWYIKKVQDGKGVGLALSKEEEAAIRNARPLRDLQEVGMKHD